MEIMHDHMQMQNGPNQLLVSSNAMSMGLFLVIQPIWELIVSLEMIGELIQAMSSLTAGCLEPVEAEALALKEALSWIH